MHASDEPAVGVRGPEVSSPRAALLSKPALALLTLLGISIAAELHPALGRLRLWHPSQKSAISPAPSATPAFEVGEAKLEMETHSQPPGSQEGLAAFPHTGPIATAKLEPSLPAIDVDNPPLPLEDASGHALDGFYRALLRTARKEPHAVTRITHFGDSIVVSDYVSGTLRRRLQQEFGDAGHGFSLLANAWPGYSHNDVYRFASSGWLVSRIVGPLAPDGLYGLGGVSFRAPPGARARFGTAKSGKFGRSVSRFVVLYLEQPSGGEFQVNLDGAEQALISSAGPIVKSRAREFKTTDGEHELEIVTKKGDFRGFGVIMERDVPGVVLDAVGVQGARIRFLDKQADEHWAEQLHLRDPQLLIYEFGANESSDGFAYPMDEYLRTMRDVLQQGRRALPDAGCLVIGALDRAQKNDTTFVSLPVIPALVKEQRRAAAEVGCAFFDTYRAMGGPGSMASWFRRGLGQADLTHPSGSGSEVLGNWIYRALVSGFKEFVRAHR